MIKILLSILILFSFSYQTYSEVFEVGPSKELATPNDVPWESLSAGDTVKIFYSEDAYKCKWVICRIGTEENPIVVHGVANPQGELPIIDGGNATTRSEINYWNEERSIIKIGGANKPEDTTPEYIIIENLDIRGGRPPAKFTGRNGASAYDNNTAAIFLEKGKHIIIRNCILRECGNGLFVANGSSDVVVEYCYIHSNGNVGSIYEHNSYTEADGILFQFNRYGFLGEGCLGNNLKDRSAGLIVRNNWIEGGNRQLDLVDSHADHIKNLDNYEITLVSGNVLIEREGEGNSQIIHFGGDSGIENDYRSKLYLWNNTIVSTRTNNTTLLRLSSASQTCYSTNNIIFVTANGNKLAMINGNGSLFNNNCFVKPNWVKDHSNGDGIVENIEPYEGNDPGFIDIDDDNYLLVETSPCVDKGAFMMQPIEPPRWVYIKHRLKAARPHDDILDIGAYEFEKPAGVNNQENSLLVYPNPIKNDCTILNIGNNEISIYNQSGDLVHGAIIYGDYTWKVDPELANGAYYIKIGNKKSIKVILVR
jgi:parallel beta helix pectate lyase-like protein/type IX secretion system substrate protein